MMDEVRIVEEPLETTKIIITQKQEYEINGEDRAQLQILLEFSFPGYFPE